jgi:hypothetical protein
LESGFTQHQYIMFRHYDADHPHLHILVNRIGYDGKVLSDSNDFARGEKVIRELEKRYKLTQVASSQQAKQRAATKDEWEMMKRTKTPSHKMKLQTIIKDALSTKDKLTCSEFMQALQARGVEARFNIASTGYVSGISYSYKGMIMTGSKLGNDFKWTSIKNRIDYEQERDHSVIRQANAGATPRQPNQSSDPLYMNSNSSTSKDFDLVSILDKQPLDNVIQTEVQSGLDPKSALGLNLKKKKKRRRL